MVAEFDGSLSADGAKESSRVRIISVMHLNIPVLTLTNVSGLKAGMEEEKDLGRDSSKTDLCIRKCNRSKGKCCDRAKRLEPHYVSMNSKSVGADMVYAWSNAEIGMMDAALAAKIMYAGADAATLKEKAAEYKELQSSPVIAARRGYVDTIIEPEDTRKYVIGAFEMLFTKEKIVDEKHGTV